jgi:hypothetical protein
VYPDYIPDWVKRRISKVATISQFMSEQCETPWSSIVNVLPKAAYRPVVGLLSFGLDDVARGFFRPRGLKPARKFRTRQRWYARPTIPELGEEIGKRLYGANEIKGRAFGSVEKFAWLADGVIQRALYYAMVFDAVLDTWYNSVLALRKQGYCSTPNPPKAAWGPRGWFMITPLDGWALDGLPLPGYNFVGPPTSGIYQSSFKFHNPCTEPLTVHFIMLYVDEFGAQIEVSRDATAPPGGDAVISHQFRVKLRQIGESRPESVTPIQGWTGVSPTGQAYMGFIPR